MIGSCYLVTDQNMIPQLAYTSRIISVTEGDPFNGSIPIVGASILMPPYQAVAAEIDGDVNRFRFEYMNYLQSTSQVNSLIAIIGEAILQGINIIIFIPKDEANLYANDLLSYISAAFGIYIGTEQVQFQLRPDAQFIIKMNCYLSDVIPLVEYLKFIPRDPNLLIPVLYKVGIDYDLFYDQPKILEYALSLWDQVNYNGTLLERTTPIIYKEKK